MEFSEDVPCDTKTALKLGPGTVLPPINDEKGRNLIKDNMPTVDSNPIQNMLKIKG